MFFLSDYPDVPEAYKHPLWKNRNRNPWAYQHDLPIIILEGQTVRERYTAIRQLKDQNLRLDTACRVNRFDDMVWLIHGIHDQQVLRDFLMDQNNHQLVRTIAVDQVTDHKLLDDLLHYGPEDTKAIISDILIDEAFFDTYDNDHIHELSSRRLLWKIKDLFHSFLDFIRIRF